MRTLLAVHQKSWKPSFWEVMDFFVLLAYASLVASRTLLQRLLACLNFTLESEDLSFWCQRKKWFLWWMQHKQLKTSWVRLDLIFSMRDIHINSNLNPLTKFTSSSKSGEFKKKYFPVFGKTFSDSHKIYKMEGTR